MLIIKLAARNLLRNPSRSMVMVLTVALSVGALFLIDGFNYGVMRQYRRNMIHFKYGNGQVYTKGYRNQAFEKPWDHWIENPDALAQRLAQVPEVNNVFPQINFHAIVAASHRSIAARGLGGKAHEESTFFTFATILDGKNLVDEPNGITLGVGLAAALDAKVGTPLTILANTINGTNNSIAVKVIGIFQSGVKEVDDNCFRMQLKRAQDLLDTNKVESMAIGLNGDKGWPALVAALDKDFDQLEAIPFEELDKVFYQNSVNWLNQRFIMVLCIIIFIVAIGITNTISFTVLERSEEIGNLRANGESSWSVLTILLWEGALAAMIGAALGVLIVYVCNTLFFHHGILSPPPPGITRPNYIKIELRPSQALFATTLCVILALLATLLAGWRQLKRPIIGLLTQR